MNWLDWVAFALVIIGALNWGLVGLLGFDLVAFLLGSMSMLSLLVYDLVGLAAIYLIIAGIVKASKAKM